MKEDILTHLTLSNKARNQCPRAEINMDLRKNLIRILILIYNRELGNQETLEDYQGI